MSTSYIDLSEIIASIAVQILIILLLILLMIVRKH